jgi:prepilin-type N-terminal cleavage/methylation domain-containing protein
MHTYRRPGRRGRTVRQAFSLIELLVAVAIVTVLIGLTLSGVSATRRAADRVAKQNWIYQRLLDPTIGVTHTRTLRILWIGNSQIYQGVNSSGLSVPATFKSLVESANIGYRVEWDWQVAGGATLQGLWEGGAAVQMIRKHDWDIVVIQDLADQPHIDPQAFFKYVRLFSEEVKRANALPMLFLAIEHSWLLPFQSLCNDAYCRIARELTEEVAPIGAAWVLASQESSINLYVDGQHGTEAGVYLNALVFYTAIFGRNPTGLTNLPPRVELHTARFLQQIAWRTTQIYRPKWSPFWRQGYASRARQAVYWSRNREDSMKPSV